MEFGIYAQDSFKATPNLTLDYGLRWDYFAPDRFEDGLMFNWNPQTGDVIVAESAMQRISPLYPVNTIRVRPGDPVPSPQKTNFGPRIGGAYRLFGGNTVIRGGYGMFVEALGQYSRLQSGGPFALGEIFFNSIQNGQPLFSFPTPFPAASGTVASQSITGYPTETGNGRIHQFNVSIDRQIAAIGFRVSYIGSCSTGLNYALNINKPEASLTPFTAVRRPYSQFVNTVFTRSDGRQNYDALSLEAQKRAGQFTFQYHYTWSSNMAYYLNLQDPYAPLAWNRVGANSRHRGVLNTMREIPFGRGRRFGSGINPVLNQIIGGWELYHVAFLQSGSYFTPSFAGSDPSNTNTVGGIPDRIADGNLPSGQRTIDRWFDPSAFAVPQPGRYGNGGVSILEGPGMHVHHLTATKAFSFNERVRARLMCAVSNLFNHPNFGLPASNISVPAQAGVISSLFGGASGGLEKADRRRVELRIRLDF